MAYFSTKLKKDFESEIGVYVISQVGRPNVYKVGMAGSANDRGTGGSRGVGDRIGQLRTGVVAGGWFARAELRVRPAQICAAVQR